MYGYIYVCAICGSPDVHICEWRTLNANEYVCGWCRCAGCQDECDVLHVDVPDVALAYDLAIVWAEAYHELGERKP